MKNQTTKHRKSSTKTRKRIGGKTFSSNNPVNLHYNNEKIVCYVCGHDTYSETIGTINKSKARSGVGQFVFGDMADVIDNTSVILYTCNHCGMCKTIRNKDPLMIIASDVRPPIQ
jgi:hypothetical protein